MSRPLDDRIGGAHPCLYSGCGEIVPEGRLTCDEHWLDVPESLRRDMVDLYAAFGDLDPRYTGAVGRVVDWLTMHSGRHHAAKIEQRARYGR